MNKNKSIIILFILINFFSCHLLRKASNNNFNVVRGKITDEKGQAIIGASIRIGGKSRGTMTDINGIFTLRATARDTLIVSYTGFMSEVLPLDIAYKVNPKSDLKISLAYENIVNVSKEGSTSVPINIFPFPPIEGYTQTLIDDKYFKNAKFLSQVGDILISALESQGYDEKSCFEIPNGFAIVTRIETINSDGTSVYNSTRFSINERESMGLTDAFSDHAGIFRIFIFIVTNKAFQPQSGSQSFAKLLKITRMGYNKLPEHFNSDKYDKKYSVTTVVYEFTADKPNTILKIRDPRLSAEKHLENSKIVFALNKR